MYRIGKRLAFEAAHRLTERPDLDVRSRLHGHCFTVEVVLASDALTFPGFVVDFAALNPLKGYLAETFDHRMLNDVLDGPPTGRTLTDHLRGWCEDTLGLPNAVTVDAVGVRTGRPDSAEQPRGWQGRCEFETAHRLPGLPVDHPCARLHGHSYTAALTLDGDALLDPDTVLRPLAAYLHERFDHRYLNEELDTPPTSEHLAAHMYGWAVKELSLPPGTHVRAARVSETASTWAEYAVGPQ